MASVFENNPSPVECFELFFDDKVWGLLVQQANQHATCKRTADPEMKESVGLKMATGSMK